MHFYFFGSGSKNVAAAQQIDMRKITTITAAMPKLSAYQPKDGTMIPPRLKDSPNVTPEAKPRLLAR